MTERKFTPPTEFPAEYVDGYGNKATVLGRSNNKHSPLIGFEHVGYARCWTEEGACRHHDRNIDLHDIPKRITSWHNVYRHQVSVDFNSRSQADECAMPGRLCVYRLERDKDGGNLKVFTENDDV